MGPNSLMVVYVDPLGVVFFCKVSATAAHSSWVINPFIETSTLGIGFRVGDS